ncbi:MAG: hydrogenase maturation peptidase HycI [Candidatus Bathyarchaeota archaeon]|nr:hydrogenase maturation peptidase HycI [Candidatus Bathyarchaeota archaeon]
MSLKDQLREFFGKDEGRRVAVLGIGSRIRGDDAVGLAIVEHLEKMRMEDVLLLKTETVPESFTGTIRKFRPTHVLMVDAAGLNEEPGEARIIPTQKIGGESISTHKLPLTVLSNFIKETMCADVALLGVQPRSIAFGAEMTPALKEAAEKVAETIREALIRAGTH